MKNLFKRSYKGLALALTGFLATSCLTPVGQFTAYQTMTFKTSTFENASRFNLAPGNYKAKISLQSHLSTMTLDGVSQKIKFKIPSDIRFTDNTTVYLTPEQTSQTYHLWIQNTKSVINENQIHVDPWDRCTVPVQTQICETIGGQRICRFETVNYDGYRRIEYYFRHTIYDVKVTMAQSTNSSAQGIFQGKDQSVARIITHAENCSMF